MGFVWICVFNATFQKILYDHKNFAVNIMLWCCRRLSSVCRVDTIVSIL